MTRHALHAIVAFTVALFTNFKQSVFDLADALDVRGAMDGQLMRMAGTTDRGQLGLGTILAAFTVVVATMVVILVIDQFDQSLGTPQSSSLSQAEGDVLSGFSSMVSLVEPLLLIGVGVVIISLIRRVQG